MFLPDLAQFDDILLESDYHKLMFFLETSDKPGLTIRQACAVESAIGASGRSVVLLMTSATVDVCSDKLEPVLGLPNLLLAHLNSSLLIEGTPLQPMFDDGRVERSCCRMIHFSDIFRMAVLYRSDQYYTINQTSILHLKSTNNDMIKRQRLYLHAFLV